MAVCVIFSAYFSATETAFSTMNRTRMKTLAEDNKRAKLVLDLFEKYDKLITTILIGNNIVNITLSSIATLYFVQLLNDNNTGATVSTAVVTVVVLIFGEITPKSIAKDIPEKFAMISAPFINMLLYLLRPITYLFSLWKKLLSRIFKKDETKMSQEELILIVEEGQQEGAIDEGEGDLIKNAIEFTERKAEDILTHRTKLIGFQKGTSKDEIAEIFAESQFSRLLVYEENLDNIVGVLHQKDFFTSRGITEREVSTLLKQPIFIPPSEKINDLLKRLQKEKSHVAVVIDEYGGTLGIVTMEDILEELVGDIWDEHDEVIETFVELEEDVFRVDASISLDTFLKFFDMEFESESVSVNGWLMEQLSKVPEENDSFVFENLEVTVTDIDPEAHRTAFIKVVRLHSEENGEEEDSQKSNSQE
ncbi:MAG: HlyC/CorC family transporter [Clostridia bacterium]|nr:HlyC/CorC family transporter [Clostridia bacterium]